MKESQSSTLAPEEEEVAALEWDVLAAVVVAAAAAVEAIAHLAAVDPDRTGMALLCGPTIDSSLRTSPHGLAGRT